VTIIVSLISIVAAVAAVIFGFLLHARREDRRGWLALVEWRERYVREGCPETQ
jgi:hypothetical protein